jgi:hypothetical protein
LQLFIKVEVLILTQVARTVAMTDE